MEIDKETEAAIELSMALKSCIADFLIKNMDKKNTKQELFKIVVTFFSEFLLGVLDMPIEKITETMGELLKEIMTKLEPFVRNPDRKSFDICSFFPETGGVH